MRLRRAGAGVCRRCRAAVRAADPAARAAAAPGGAGSTCRRARRRQVGEAGDALRDERVARIGPRQRGGDAEAGRQLARHVLHRVHGDVGAAFLHRDLEFLDEQTLAADLGERAVLHPVALRAHRHEFDRQCRDERRGAARRRARPARGRACCVGWRCVATLAQRTPGVSSFSWLFSCRRLRRSGSGTVRRAGRARSVPRTGR